MSYAKRAMLTFTLLVMCCVVCPFMSWANSVLDITRVDNTIQSVLNAYPQEIKQFSPLYRILLIETALVESDMGVVLNCMGNYGYYQIRGTTGKDLLGELKDRRPDIYKVVMKYHDANKSLKDNLMHNLSFSTAMCIAFYCMKVKDPAKELATLENRAHTWKKLYNTYHGAGSVNGYIKKSKPVQHEIRIKPLFGTTTHK